MADPTFDPAWQRFSPRPEDVTSLIDRAEKHPLGTDFLLQGALDAVAATFQVHAFVVDAARDTLRTGPQPYEIRTVSTGPSVTSR